MADQTAGMENGSGERPSCSEGLSPDPFSSPAVWSVIFQSGALCIQSSLRENILSAPLLSDTW